MRVTHGSSLTTRAKRRLLNGRFRELPEPCDVDRQRQRGQRQAPEAHGLDSRIDEETREGNPQGGGSVLK